MTTPDTILFAVQAGLRLHGAIRKAYVDGTRARPLVLPLPPSAGIGVDSAVTFFSVVASDEVREAYPRAAALALLDERTSAEQGEILGLYRAYLAVHEAASSEDGERLGGITADELSALATIRQWETSEPGVPSPLQRIGGTLVNIAVDYFLESPGRISERSAEGRALRTFLQAVDEVDFAEVEAADIVPGLLLAVLDSAAENGDLFGQGRGQALMHGVTRRLAESARTHLEGASARERRDAGAWLELVARAVLEGGAETALANPERFFGVDADEAPFVSDVGGALADLLLSEETLSLRPLLSAEGLTAIARAALESLADNPELLRLKHDGLKKIVLAVAKDVAALPGTFSKDIVPEVVRLVLEKSAGNMDLLWGKEFRRADRHLLVTASSLLLKELARKPAAGGAWRAQLSREQVLEVLEGVLDEVVAQPDWLLELVEGEDPVLAQALEAAFAALRRVDGRRLSSEVAVGVLRASLGAVAMQIHFLDRLQPAGAAATVTALEALLDAVFEVVFGDEQHVTTRWKLARRSVFLAALQVVFEVLAETLVDLGEIEVVRLHLLAELQQSEPFDPDDFGNLLHEALLQEADA